MIGKTMDLKRGKLPELKLMESLSTFPVVNNNWILADGPEMNPRCRGTIYDDLHRSRSLYWSVDRLVGCLVACSDVRLVKMPLELPTEITNDGIEPHRAPAALGVETRNHRVIAMFLSQLNRGHNVFATISSQETCCIANRSA